MNIDVIKTIINTLISWTLSDFMFGVLLDVLQVLLCVAAIIGFGMPYAYDASLSEDDFKQIFPNAYLAKFFCKLYHIQLNANGIFGLLGVIVLKLSDMFGKLNLHWVSSLLVPHAIKFLGGWLLVAAVAFLFASVLARIIIANFVESHIDTYRALDPRTQSDARGPGLPHRSLDSFMGIQALNKDYFKISHHLGKLGQDVCNQLTSDHLLRNVAEKLCRFGPVRQTNHRQQIADMSGENMLAGCSSSSPLDRSSISSETTTHDSFESSVRSPSPIDQLLNLFSLSSAPVVIDETTDPSRLSTFGPSNRDEMQDNIEPGFMQKHPSIDQIVAEVHSAIDRNRDVYGEMPTDLHDAYNQYQSDLEGYKADASYQKLRENKVKLMHSAYQYLFHAMRYTAPDIRLRGNENLAQFTKLDHVREVKSSLDFLKDRINAYNPLDRRHISYGFLKLSLNTLNEYYDGQKYLRVYLTIMIAHKKTKMHALALNQRSDAPKTREQLDLESEVKLLKKELNASSYHAALIENLLEIERGGRIDNNRFMAILEHEMAQNGMQWDVADSQSSFLKDVESMPLTEKIVFCWRISHRYLNSKLPLQITTLGLDQSALLDRRDVAVSPLDFEDRYNNGSPRSVCSI